ARNRLHLFGSDCGGVGEGGGAAPCNRGCEKNCFLRHSLSFRLEIWAREDFRAQPVSITDPSTSLGMTITFSPTAYFQGHRVLLRLPPPVCSGRFPDQGQALPSALQRQRSWHVQARSPKALHRSARA